VKYTATRSEAFLERYQGRDLGHEVELALDAGGRFLACGRPISAMWARARVAVAAEQGAGLIPGSYAIPAASCARFAATPNTMRQRVPQSGRPEVTYAIERWIDAAAELDIDRVKLPA